MKDFWLNKELDLFDAQHLFNENLKPVHLDNVVIDLIEWKEDPRQGPVPVTFTLVSRLHNNNFLIGLDTKSKYALEIQRKCTGGWGIYEREFTVMRISYFVLEKSFTNTMILDSGNVGDIFVQAKCKGEMEFLF